MGVEIGTVRCARTIMYSRWSAWLTIHSSRSRKSFPDQTKQGFGPAVRPGYYSYEQFFGSSTQVGTVEWASRSSGGESVSTANGCCCAPRRASQCAATHPQDPMHASAAIACPQNCASLVVQFPHGGVHSMMSRSRRGLSTS